MAIPTLAPNSTWFSQGGTTVTRASITEINIVDRYTPTGNETASWDASAAKDGSVMCYVDGTVLTIAGNGSGKIYANADSSYVFSDNTKKDYFNTLTTISGIEILDSQNATTLLQAFRECRSLTSLDLSSWDITNVTNLGATFQHCTSLETVNLTNWNTENVTDMGSLFFTKNAYGVMSLKTILGVESWDVSKAEFMDSMFGACAYIESLDLSNWKTSACTDMKQMFCDCYALKSLNVSTWDTSNVQSFAKTFSGCPALKTLDISNWSTAACTDMSGMFLNTPNLEKVKLSSNFAFKSGATLPIPDPAYINGADGNWYDRDKNAYAPSAVPSNKAATYYASLALIPGYGMSTGEAYLLHRIFSRLNANALTGKWHWAN